MKQLKQNRNCPLATPWVRAQGSTCLINLRVQLRQCSQGAGKLDGGATGISHSQNLQAVWSPWAVLVTQMGCVSQRHAANRTSPIYLVTVGRVYRHHSEPLGLGKRTARPHSSPSWVAMRRTHNWVQGGSASSYRRDVSYVDLSLTRFFHVDSRAALERIKLRSHSFFLVLNNTC